MTSISDYSEQLIPLTRDELVAKLKIALDSNRFHHVLRVEQTAIDLAKANGVDLEKASIAGLCHDYAKQRSDADFLAAIDRYGLAPDLKNWANPIWHGVVGAELVKHELGVWDEDILNAIRHHTTGDATMSLLEQVVYMADYIEPGRDFPGVEQARQLTHKLLALGVAYQTKRTLEYLLDHGSPIYPATILTYNAWVPKYEGEING
ncbi:bis(5'-nucleosyl)-tetraphosphatase (symmetrical) YqeK [Limosilactobacillus difficilis]|uniref:bis(5'-nucleosyl)-tetraphosphatase (symmetrical) YqeK n=1 Tax=Limosilactobacillus difficilis TaxID=2991838 RepID=UPI0024BA9F32|nr:bis(5'-nucleosyl)-tetraphosphatase (symmetrical) YqeK [Limosilactobacillus difficilis]